MSQFTNIAMQDGTATARTFNVSNIEYSTGVATWLFTGASYDASTVASFSLRAPSKQSTRTRIRARIVIPIMDPVLVTKKIDELVGEVTFQIPKISSLVQRKDLQAFVRNFLFDAVITNGIETNQGVY